MNKLLSFRRVFGKHAGEHQAQIVLEVLRELQIQDRVDCLVGHNAAVNVSAVFAILGSLHPTPTRKQCSAFRIRCLGHIINFCAHALISGKGKGEGDQVGRLRDIVKYKRWSLQRHGEFANCIWGGGIADFDHLTRQRRTLELVLPRHLTRARGQGQA